MIHAFPPRHDRRRRMAAARLDPARWAAISKAAAAVAVEDGYLSVPEACALCRMDEAELEVWQHVMQDRGLRRIIAGRM